MNLQLIGILPLWPLVVLRTLILPMTLMMIISWIFMLITI